MSKVKYLKLQKQEDKRPEDSQVKEGDIIEGFLLYPIKVGEKINLYPHGMIKLSNYPKWWTSRVKSFNEETIETENSIYKIL